MVMNESNNGAITDIQRQLGVNITNNGFSFVVFFQRIIPKQRTVPFQIETNDLHHCLFQRKRFRKRYSQGNTLPIQFNGSTFVQFFFPTSIQGIRYRRIHKFQHETNARIKRIIPHWNTVTVFIIDEPSLASRTHLIRTYLVNNIINGIAYRAKHRCIRQQLHKRVCTVILIVLPIEQHAPCILQRHIFEQFIVGDSHFAGISRKRDNKK